MIALTARFTPFFFPRYKQKMNLAMIVVTARFTPCAICQTCRCVINLLIVIDLLI